MKIGGREESPPPNPLTLSVHSMRLQNLWGLFIKVGHLALHRKHTVVVFHNDIMNTFKPEPKKSTLGQFRPETMMRGRWIGFTALGCFASSLVLNELWGWIPGVILAASAVALGKLGLDSKGRGLSLIVLILGVVLIGAYLTVLIVGKENWVIAPVETQRTGWIAEATSILS